MDRRADSGSQAAILAMLGTINERLERVEGTVEKVRDLTMEARDLGLRTNGRVTELERYRAEHGEQTRQNMDRIDAIEKKSERERGFINALAVIWALGSMILGSFVVQHL